MTQTRVLYSTAIVTAIALAMPAAAQKPAAAPPAAAPAAAPPAPAPSKELEAFMKGFEGTWHCDTKFPAGAMGPGSPETMTKATATIQRDFGGMSWHGHVDVQAAKGVPALTAVVQIGWEPGTKQATIVSYDSMGSVLLGIGPLSGESVTFAEQEYTMGMKVKSREIFTKKGPKELFHAADIDMGQGFQRVGEDVCRK